jgi:hypothetical protein
MRRNLVGAPRLSILIFGLRLIATFPRLQLRLAVWRPAGVSARPVRGSGLLTTPITLFEQITIVDLPFLTGVFIGCLINAWDPGSFNFVSRDWLR